MTYKKNNLLLILWVITVAIMFVLLFSHTYNDIVITTRQGIQFWHILFDGKILDFYQVNILESGNASYTAVQGCAYNILVYLTFALWNIPLAVLEVLTNVDVMNNIFCLAYAKLLPIAAMLVSVIILRKIFDLMEIPQESQLILCYLYVSSALMITVIFIISQYDILGLIFQLLGLYAFLKNDNRKFILWFGVAFCFKYFSLVIFLPLLLLRQKKLGNCLASLVGMVIPVIATKLPFMFASGNAAESLGGEQMTMEFLRNMLSYSSIYMNLFVVAYVLILVWCYQHGNEMRLSAEAVWVCFISYGMLFALCNAYPYWSILLAPFFVLVIAISPRQSYLTLLLETFGGAALVLANMLKYNWCYFGRTMDTMIMPKLFTGASYEGSRIYNIFAINTGNSYPYIVANSIFLAAIIALSYVTCPKENAISQENDAIHLYHKDILIFRMMFMTAICSLPVLSLFI